MANEQNLRPKEDIMKVENRKLDEIAPYKKNAKKHDKTQIVF